MGELIGLLITLGLLLLGWLAGRAAEHMHLSSLDAREKALAHMFVTDLRTFPGGADPARGAALVHGEVVVATDYLKSFLAGFRKLVGGELRSYHSLMTRARREAVLRMLEDAHRQGYNAVCNLRLGSADIGGMTGKKGAAMVEAFAWGTAYCTTARSDAA